MKAFFVYVGLTLPATLYAFDHELIDQLPVRMIKAMKQFHELADTGVGSNMRSAGRTLIGEEQDMIRELVQTYYRNQTVTSAFLQRYFENVENIVAADGELDNPSGESRGSGETLFALSNVQDRLADRISNMVKAITEEDPEYIKAWQKKWASACTVGN